MMVEGYVVGDVPWLRGCKGCEGAEKGSVCYGNDGGVAKSETVACDVFVLGKDTARDMWRRGMKFEMWVCGERRGK